MSQERTMVKFVAFTNSRTKLSGIPNLVGTCDYPPTQGTRLGAQEFSVSTIPLGIKIMIRGKVQSRTYGRSLVMVKDLKVAREREMSGNIHHGKSGPCHNFKHAQFRGVEAIED
ncbi:hypothetical protein QTP70_009223 [Hemibagrus guttatus]|uniref:Uncharacterized protein n=1 Tax=Hemibagrus guttatus TaxID=175788 RepID=A0AAE0QKG7_9TELE|nr:hypothetical protein QTP70_009223 [Hemibagrus guttatus]